MLRFSTWIRVAAIIGVLVHAALIVWHNGSMLGAALQQGVVAATLSQICHNGPAAAPAAQDTIDESQPEGGDQGGCPICKGMASAVAVLPSPDIAVDLPDQATMRLVIVGKSIARRLAYVRPPSRGPPTLPA